MPSSCTFKQTSVFFCVLHLGLLKNERRFVSSFNVLFTAGNANEKLVLLGQAGFSRQKHLMLFHCQI